MNAVDTNILIYVHDPRDAAKQSTAASLVRNLVDGILLWQVAVEYLANAHKLKPHGFDLNKAFQVVDGLCQVWKLAAPTPGMLARCRKLMNSISISYWDALILAGSLEAGADRLYSEDINPGGKIDGLEIINPFAKP